MKTSYDQGKTWEIEQYKMVFGAYFFLSEDKVERFKILANISEIVTILEGVAALIFIAIRYLPSYINAK